jgi:precorrin-6A/cobalt-precorrin-6A reductase
MKLLLIAGMGESVSLARDLSALKGVEVTCVNEGRAVARAAPPVKTHEGTFADDAEFGAFLRDEGFEFIVDAAHPFQSKLGQVAAISGLPYLRATRPIWAEGDGEDWIKVTTMTDAIAAVPQGATLFVVTGRGTLRHLSDRRDVTVYCRQLDQHDQEFPLEKGRFIFGNGPFETADEIALFQMLGVDTVLLRNSGSVAGASKLDAARACNIRIVMIEPPALEIAPDQVLDIADIPERVRIYADHRN